MSSSSSSSSSTPLWHSWPHSLPTLGECRATPEFHRLFDQGRIKNMHAEIRSRLFAVLPLLSAPAHSAILLFGGTSADFDLYDTDTSKTDFRQESFFQYLFGVNEPDCYGVIDISAEGKNEVLFFVPETTEDSQRWNGTRRPLSYHTDRYGFASTHLTSDLDSVLKSRGISHLLTLQGVNTDSGSACKTVPSFATMSSYTRDESKLHNVLCELRVLKTPLEIEVLRLSNIVSSAAHVYVMRHIRSGLSELQLEALYKSWCLFHGGARHCAYTCICGSGENGAILHYGHAARPNERILADGDTCVLDMGAEFCGYATDITRSYPVNGVFTKDQRIVHEAVHDAQKRVIDAMKPGVFWPDMHRLAEEVILTHLLKCGLLHNGTVADFQSAHIGAVFMPHGLGHMLGLNVHDVGGYVSGTERSKEPGVCYLRCGRKLEEGMFITVEPGLYFNDPTLDKALANESQSKYINTAVLDRFRGTGGCRLEDDVLVTKTGAENLTILPTSVEEIEEVMKEARRAGVALQSHMHSHHKAEAEHHHHH